MLNISVMITFLETDQISNIIPRANSVIISKKKKNFFFNFFKKAENTAMNLSF